MTTSSKVHPSDRASRAGFTLMEVLLVVVIMSILAGIATLSVRSHVNRARMARALDQLEHFDRLARTSARRDGVPYRLSFDKSHRRVELQSTAQGQSKASRRTAILPNGIGFKAFRDRATVSKARKFEIDVSAAGQSPTYAIALETNSGTERWLVTLGFSGQQVSVEDAKHVAELFP